jgi:hypothetical protein
VSPPRIAALDTNILLLRLVAETDPSLLRSFKRVQIFDERDIPILANVLRAFSRLISTPHVLSEVSNFVDQAPQYRRVQLIEVLKRFIDDDDEVYEEARMLSMEETFAPIGLTDTGLFSLSNRATIVTMDFRLAGAIDSAGGSAINFNHLRYGYLRKR